MSYSPTTWVEKVTKVGPTNLNKLELGVQATAVVADAALPTPAGSNGQFLKRVGGVWVPTSFAASDIPNYPSDATKLLKGDGTWGPSFAAYTPVWTAAGTAPSLGNGTLSGRYIQLGKLVVLAFTFVAGTTTTFGTSDWFFTLPVNSNGSRHYGSCELVDDSASTGYAAVARVENATQTKVLFTDDTAIGVSEAGFIGSTVPFTWATLDAVRFTLMYEAA